MRAGWKLVRAPKKSLICLRAASIYSKRLRQLQCEVWRHHFFGVAGVAFLRTRSSCAHMIYISWCRTAIACAGWKMRGARDARLCWLGVYNSYTRREMHVVSRWRHSDGADFRNELPPPENLMRPKKLALSARSGKRVKEREIMSCNCVLCTCVPDKLWGAEKVDAQECS